MLLSFPKYSNQKPDVENDIKNCIEFLLSIQTQEGKLIEFEN
jgi:chorismate mutase